jgi:septum site-determining protein MinC
MVDLKQMNIQIKGIKDGLLVTLGEGDWGNLREELIRYIGEKENFFKGAKVALEVGNHPLHTEEIDDIRSILRGKDISLWAILSNSSVTEQTAKNLGLATSLAQIRPDRTIKPIDTELAGEGAIFVQRTMRSGFRVSFAGHVIVLGDVNPGAEIIAKGSVIIWGRLRGVVHAGAEGDETAVVCALDLNPTQLRIASQVAVTPGRKGKPQPEIASVQGGRVVAEYWDHK